MYFLSIFNKHVQFVLVPLANGRMLKLFPIEWLQMVYVSGSNIKKIRYFKVMSKERY